MDKKLSICAFPWQQMVIDPTGDVTPCCYYHAYSSSGTNAPLGNVNAHSIKEVWNSDQYRALREAHKTGDIPQGHPCHECMTFKINKKYPTYDPKIGVFEDAEGKFVCEIPQDVAEGIRSSGAARLLEDGVTIAQVNLRSSKQANQVEGSGAYLIGNLVTFESSDETPVVLNGRSYHIATPDQVIPLPFFGFDKNAKSGINLIKNYQEYTVSETVLQSTPTMLGYASSVDCNLDCDYCSQNEHRAARLKLREDADQEIIELVENTILFTWAGGEPFFLKPFRDFLINHDVSSNPNLLFGFTSNGTMILRDQLEKLKLFPRVSASVSIDSFVKETYERLRAPAKFERVIRNYKTLQEPANRMTWHIQSGMLVMKSNVAEIDKNVQFAIDNGIELNLSPILQYPLTERLDLFSDFKIETSGWKEAIDRAIEINNEGLKNGTLPQNMGGALQVIKNNFEITGTQYNKAKYIEIVVDDAFDSLPTHHRPGIVLGSNANNPVGYVEIDRGPGKYKLWIKDVDIPKLGAEAERQIKFFHNLVEPWLPAVTESLSWDYLERSLGIQKPALSIVPWIKSKLRKLKNFGQNNRRSSADEQSKDPSLVKMSIPRLHTPKKLTNASLAKHLGKLTTGVLNYDGSEISASIRKREIALRNAAEKVAATTPLRVNLQDFQPDGGYSYRAVVPISAEYPSDYAGYSALRLLEDGSDLPLPHSSHDKIRSLGAGRYSHWVNTIYMSTSDNSDPRNNGKEYVLAEFENGSTDSNLVITVPSDSISSGDGFSFLFSTSLLPFNVESDITGFSCLALFEDGKQLGGHALHEEIRNVGMGLYSHWGEYILFSSTDNTDPRTNKRVYTVKKMPKDSSEVDLYKPVLHGSMVN